MHEVRQASDDKPPKPIGGITGSRAVASRNVLAAAFFVTLELDRLADGLYRGETQERWLPKRMLAAY
ncbi:hypothetical protein [Paenibacillus agricola]|uniref:Uncharacterized protein n=1 Tax=Paenibacillus agricola TaxID=2716264 RepID=A0ABX0IZX2_9BACL|nr:hypothetical protein [Paenibacillus agricola]NHN29557.1 hypothetical protein [Paenibacillus agricola]